MGTKEVWVKAQGNSCTVLQNWTLLMTSRIMGTRKCASFLTRHVIQIFLNWDFILWSPHAFYHWNNSVMLVRRWQIQGQSEIYTYYGIWMSPSSPQTVTNYIFWITRQLKVAVQEVIMKMLAFSYPRLKNLGIIMHFYQHKWEALSLPLWMKHIYPLLRDLLEVAHMMIKQCFSRKMSL